MVLFLHVGQGGNAVGACFWQHAARERGPRRWLLDASGRCRCVLVDTEPKAVHAAVQAVGPQRLHARCALVERGGRGNSWAMGYHGIAPAARAPSGAEPGIAAAALEALRWQWERSDGIRGVVMCHALAGGTGSGLGSRLLEELRDAHPRAHLVAASVAPFAGGELPVGSYNAVLALAHLQALSDAVLLFPDTEPPAEPRIPAGSGANAAPHSAQVDAHIARSLAGLCFPTDGGAGARPFDPGDLVSAVCPLPALKLLELHSAPAPPPAPAGVGPARVARAPPAGGWDALVAACADQMARYDLRRRPVRTLSTQATARGVEHEPPSPACRARLQQRLGAASCSPFPIAWTLSEGGALPSAGMPRTLTLASNRSSAAASVGQIAARARLQLSARAYLHHYEAHGVEAGYLREQLDCVEQVVADYEALLPVQ